MKKIKKLLFLVCLIFGLFLSTNLLAIKACEENVVNVIISEDDCFEQDFTNNNYEVDVSDYDIVIEDDNNPDGVFLMKINVSDLEQK